MDLKKRIFIGVSLFYILLTVVPIFQSLAGLELWMVNLTTFIILIALFPAAVNNIVFFWFLVYATVLALFVLSGKPLTIGIGSVVDTKKIFIEYAFFLPNFAIFSILYYLKDIRLYKFISFGGLAFLIFSFFYLLPILSANNLAMRDAHVMRMEQNINTPGVPGYPLMHAYILLVPAIFYGIKNTYNRTKWMLIGVLFLVLYIILQTYVTTSLVITLGIIIIAILYDAENKVRSIFFILVTGLVVYILHLLGFFLQMFDVLIAFFDETSVQPKIEGFKYIYEFGDVENSGRHITGRMNYHDMSWEAFYENILIGGNSPVGGHSSLIDRLGGMGLVAFVPFVMIVVAQAKMLNKILMSPTEKLFYWIGWGAALMVLYQKGLFGQEGWLFLMVLLPGLIISFRFLDSQKPRPLKSKN